MTDDDADRDDDAGRNDAGPDDIGHEDDHSRGTDPSDRRDRSERRDSSDGGDSPLGDDPAPDAGPEAPGSAAEDDDTSRRWLIRIMIALAIGLPIAIEFRTLVGLVERAFGGGEGGGDAGTTTNTTDAGGVGVGDDLLPATEETERVADAFVSTAGSERTFTLAVRVENGGTRPYRLRIGDLRADGETVSGETATDPVPSGESTSLVARWTLPEGATPREVRVEGEYVESGTVVGNVGEWVPLGNVPVR